MLRKFIIAPALVVALVSGGYASTTQAAVIGTQQALSAERRAATETQVRDGLAREDVRQAMERMGVDPSDAQARVASLSDAELMQVQGQIDRLPAGGSALAVIGVVFVVLLILELVGVIDIFKRT